MSLPVCTLEGVTKTFNSKKIINNISFSIPKGEVTALLGPNGAGKTTTIRLMLGLLKPDSGNIHIFGQSIGNRKRMIGKIGLLAQDDAGYKQLSTFENLNFMFKLNNIKIEEIYDEFIDLIQQLDLEDKLYNKWGTLSGGEKRAFGFIRAIFTGSELLFLDEPTTGLDLARAVKIRKIIQDQVKMGKTVLMSSHIITDLEKLSQNIIIMKNGRIVFTGTKNKVLELFSDDNNLETAIVNAFTEDV